MGACAVWLTLTWTQGDVGQVAHLTAFGIHLPIAAARATAHTNSGTVAFIHGRARIPVLTARPDRIELAATAAAISIQGGAVFALLTRNNQHCDEVMKELQP